MSRFAFVAAERANHAVATLCRVVGASVSGFYAWLRAVPSVQAREAARVLAQVDPEHRDLPHRSAPPYRSAGEPIVTPE